MNIQQYIFNQRIVLLPISGGNGQSQDQAVILGAEGKYVLLQVENEFISAMLEGYWKKIGQSLIIEDDGRKYDKVIIQHFLDDDEVAEQVFWFEISECFGNNK